MVGCGPVFLCHCMEVFMSLTKLVILGGIGYLVYRFFSSLPHPEASGAGMHQSAGRSASRGHEGGARITGGGRGMTETTAGASGESVPHAVGRGVRH
jgi:hypothetical protein